MPTGVPKVGKRAEFCLSVLSDGAIIDCLPPRTYGSRGFHCKYHDGCNDEKMVQ